MEVCPFWIPACKAIPFTRPGPGFRSLPSITGRSTFGTLFAKFASYPAGRFFSICKVFGAAFIVATSCPPFSRSTSTPSFAYSGCFPLTSQGCFGMNPTPLLMRTRKNEPPLDFGPTTHFFFGGGHVPALPSFASLQPNPCTFVTDAHLPA
jgi:hypothetical protein